MNMVAMRDGQAATFGAGNNVLAVWKDGPNAKTIITTANPDVIYGLAFVDLKDGPVVLEAVQQMRGLPVQRDTLVTVAAAALLPFLPAAAIEVPLKDVLARLIGMLL